MQTCVTLTTHHGPLPLGQGDHRLVKTSAVMSVEAADVEYSIVYANLGSRWNHGSWPPLPRRDVEGATNLDVIAPRPGNPRPGIPRPGNRAGKAAAGGGGGSEIHGRIHRLCV